MGAVLIWAGLIAFVVAVCAGLLALLGASREVIWGVSICISVSGSIMAVLAIGGTR